MRFGSERLRISRASRFNGIKEFVISDARVCKGLLLTSSRIKQSH